MKGKGEENKIEIKGDMKERGKRKAIEEEREKRKRNREINDNGGGNERWQERRSRRNRDYK